MPKEGGFDSTAQEEGRGKEGGEKGKAAAADLIYLGKRTRSANGQRKHEPESSQQLLVQAVLIDESVFVFSTA